jgi:mono/diheme cytochrome c family protein
MPSTIAGVRRALTAAGCGAAAVLLLASCGGGHVPLPALAASTVGDTAGLVARGEYIVRNVAVCGHCHSADPRNADAPLSGGFAFRNWRLGTVRASNLTPDVQTGLGAWTDAEIVRAIRSGEDREGHTLAPVMPYAWFRGMSERDALAIARYLKSLPPVRNQVHNSPSLVYRAARLFTLGPARPTATTAPRPGADVEYGRYLANNVSLCGECHTPRGGLQQKADMDRLFAGDATSDFPANPSNITPDEETGIGRWTEDGFLRALRTGVTPGGDRIHPFMPWRELGRMRDDDLRAIYRYLHALPPIRNAIPEKQVEQPAG